MPRYTVVIHELAVLDIQEAIDWYNKQSPGLGKSFLNKVKNRLKHLQKFPKLSVKYANIRTIALEKFSDYLIHFIVDDSAQQIIIVGVLSTKRNAQIWLDRLSKSRK